MKHFMFDGGMHLMDVVRLCRDRLRTQVDVAGDRSAEQQHSDINVSISTSKGIHSPPVT